VRCRSGGVVVGLAGLLSVGVAIGLSSGAEPPVPITGTPVG